MKNRDYETGILTFHRTHNFGAFLQCFALTRILKEEGFKPTVINYQDKAQWLAESWPVIRKFRRPIRMLDFISKSAAFKTAQQHFPLTPYTRDPQELFDWHFKRVVVGSDIVWNYLINDCQSPFFGNFNADIRVAYAPSFGWASPTDPPPTKLGSQLAKFDSISVRDENSRQIVQSVTGRTVPIVLDPTLLFDFAGFETRPKHPAFASPYLLIYAFEMGEDEMREIKRIARERNLKIVVVGYRLTKGPGDYTVMGLNPFEWLWAIKHATLIYTNTFHGSIFCIKYARQFAVKMGYSVQPKLEPLLVKTGLTGRVVENIGNLRHIFATDENYPAAHTIIKAEADRSRHWLHEALAIK